MFALRAGFTNRRKRHWNRPSSPLLATPGEEALLATSKINKKDSAVDHDNEEEEEDDDDDDENMRLPSAQLMWETE